MAIPATGPVSASDVNAELGRSPTGAFSMNDAVVRAFAEKPGDKTRISFSDFQDRSGTLVITPTGQYTTWSAGEYNYISWLVSGSITVEGVGNVDVLLQAGGGGGGAGRWSGGGGAGGCVLTSMQLAFGTYSVTVGAGGSRMPQWPGFSSADPSTSGTRGGDSVFNGIVAYGGGAQKSYIPGGCGAGGSFSNMPTFGSGTAGQGYPGGAGDGPFPNPANYFRSGGGGGIAQAGSKAGTNPSFWAGGYGGSGSNLSSKAPGWDGSPSHIPYANGWGGGGSGSAGTSVPQGTTTTPPIGYGAGGFPGSSGASAGSHSGSGGGSGGFYTSTNYQGGNGGSGFVAIRFKGTTS